MGFVSSDFMYVRKPSGTPQPRRKISGSFPPTGRWSQRLSRIPLCVPQSLGPSH